MFVIRYDNDSSGYRYFQKRNSADPAKWGRGINMAEIFFSQDGAHKAFDEAVVAYGLEDSVPAHKRFEHIYIVRIQISASDYIPWPIIHQRKPGPTE